MRQPAKKKKSRWRIFFKILFILVVVGLLLSAGFLAGAYYHFSRDLPPLYSLKQYDPNLITQIYSDDGTLIAEFSDEKRRMVPPEEIPEVVKKAFIAVEDKRFFEHQGIDYTRIGGAIYHNIRDQTPRREGASTITMQVARTFFLSQKKVYSRKIKEAILAFRIERYLTKQEILYLYLHQIYLGERVYGIGAAAEHYFGKQAKDLNLAEAAVLAGLPRQPAVYNPTKHFKNAKERQKLVLKIMEDEGLITPQENEQAYKQPISIAEPENYYDSPNAYFIEHIRRLLVRDYGEDALLRGGLEVFTTLNIDLQAKADEAVKDGLAGSAGLDKRQGYRGPLKTLSGDSVHEFIESTEESLRNEWRGAKRKTQASAGLGPEGYLALSDPPDPMPLETGKVYQGIVTRVSDSEKQADIWVGHSSGSIKLSSMRWAREPDPWRNPEWTKLSRISKALSKGDVILVRVQERVKAGKGYFHTFTLEQAPAVQAGLIAFSSHTGEVKALIGGYEFAKSELIRPIQSRRLPGSSFKPIYYAAALDDPLGRFTPATILYDTAIVYDSLEPGQINPGIGWWKGRWAPSNYSKGFTGPRTMREALEHSINTISIKIASELGLSTVQSYARRLGITSPLVEDMTIALGTSPTTLLEMCRAYNVFASGGYVVQPKFITKVYDKRGRLLYFDEPPEYTGELWYDEELIEVEGDQIIEEDLDEVGYQKPRSPQEQGAAAEPSEVGQPTYEEYLSYLKSGNHPVIVALDTPVDGRKVLSEQTAFLMNYMLSGVVIRGTAARAKVIEKPIAGKTGTTNKYIDAWFIGYSPELMCGVWVGHDYGRMLGVGEAGSKAALPIWIDFMKHTLEDRPEIDFPVPSGIEFAVIDQTNGLLATDSSEKTFKEAFKQGTAPTEYAPEISSTRAKRDFFRNDY